MSTIDASETLTLQDYFATTLQGGISATDTVIPLSSAPTATEGFLALDLGTAGQELIYYNSASSTTVTVPSVARGRGVGGTSASPHSSGASVKQVVNADYFKELQNGNANTGLHTWFKDGTQNYVALGLVWTADSVGSTLNGSMTSGVAYINGKRLTLVAITAHAFTASKDTYVDVTFTSGNNVGTVVFTEATTNAASPALAANSIRIAIIVTAATIAATGSINQGDVASVVPIASSTPYAVTDSLGNLIFNHNPTPVLIGYRQVVTDQASITTQADATGLAVTILAPGNRKVELEVNGGFLVASATADVILYLMEGATQLNFNQFQTSATSSHATGNSCRVTIYPTAGAHTYKVQVAAAASATLKATATSPVALTAKLV